MPSSNNFERLSVAQLKEKLEKTWLKYEKVCRESMGELLYCLRKKLKAPGKRNDLRGKKVGFGAWCEANLGISRRTADRWADEWAISQGLKKPSKKSKRTFGHSSKGPAPDGKVSVNVSFVLSEQEQDQFLEAMDILGEQAERIIFDAVINAAKKRPTSDHQADRLSAHA